MRVRGIRGSALSAVLTLTFTGAGISELWAAAPDLPPGRDLSKPAPLNMPGKIIKWRAVIARSDLPVYQSFEGTGRIAEAPPGLGEVCYVAHDHNRPGSPRRLLLGRFEKDGEQFVSWVGWVDECYVLDEARPLQVKAAREYLRTVMPPSHPMAKRVNTLLPDASREDYQNVTLKAVTHPERGKACFPRPVAAEEYEAALKTGKALPLQPFAFFYVFKVAVEPKGVYCLLGPRSDVQLDGIPGEKLRDQVSGWVDINSLILWTTREAFEYRLEPAALQSRVAGRRPIELYASDKDLRDWAQWELSGRKGPSAVKPIFSEELDHSKAPAFMLQPWPAEWMRYPILSSYNLQGQARTPPPGISGRWLGYQLCMLGSTEGTGAYGGGAGAPDIEESKKRLNAAVARMNVFELVLVIDTTGSMRPVFDPLKKAVVEMVRGLKARALSERDELEKIQLRVGVVLYKDFKDQDSEYLTKTSNEFFDVMSTAGTDAFEKWMDTEVKDGGGGDGLEEPYEGIAAAVKQFLTPGDSQSRHTSGAARVCMVFGDAGNHDKRGNTRLDGRDVLNLLQPVATGDRGGAGLAKVQLHTVMTNLRPNHGVTPEAVQWKRQMPDLARQSGGTAHEVDFKDDAATAAAVERLGAALNTAIEARRALMRKELEAIRNGFGTSAGASGGGGTGSVGAAPTVISRDRLGEILGKDEVARLTTGLSKAFFSVVNAVEQVPGESEEKSRLKLSILLTEQEFIRIQSVCQILGVGLEDEISKGDLGRGGEKIETKIKDLVIKCMLAAFGETPTAGKVGALMAKSLPDIQLECSGLPVQFGCLKKLPRDEDELKKMARVLKQKAGGLLQIISTKRERFFAAGVATGEKHIWVYREELP